MRTRILNNLASALLRATAFGLIAALVLGGSFRALAQAKLVPKLSITITEPAHAGKGGPDQTEPISGEVRGVDYGTHKVVIYTFAGGTWWVQPTVAEPLTDIDQSGKWQTITHLGSTYAALLVRPSYRPPATTNSVPKVGPDVLAVTLVAGRK
jgi:hypothetical protein